MAPERPPEPLVGRPATFLDGLETGWPAVVATVRGVLVVVGALLPGLVVAGLVTAAAPRRGRRRTVEGRRQGGDRTATPEGPGPLGFGPAGPKVPVGGAPAGRNLLAKDRPAPHLRHG